jgi:hypothetical protein
MAGDARGPRHLDDDSPGNSSNSGGDSLELEELARLDPGALASRVRSQARELERLRTAEADRTAELQRLAAEVESLGGDVAPKTAKAAAKRCAGATRDTPGCSFVEPDQETLLEMARCSTVKVDGPGFLNHDEAIAPPSAEQRAAAGLSEQESGSLTQAGERFRRQYAERMQQLYLEAGGIPEAIDGMSAGAIESMTGALFHNEELAHARRRLAQERAGLIEVDKAALSLADHYVRHLLGVGDAYEEVVAEALGPERARELRLLDDGWSGGTSVYSGDCEE